MGYLQHIERCNRFDLAGFRRFFVADQPVGWLRHRFAGRLADWPVFEHSGDMTALSPRLDNFAARSAAVAEVAAELAGEGALPAPRGEAFPVTTSLHAPPLMQIDRAFVPHFGVVAYGVQLNGFVQRPDGPHLWIGRRSSQVIVEPGKLDNLVAGGQPIGLGLRENLIKEAQEEAGLPPDLAQQARPVGAITYTREIEAGLKPDVLFVFDLELSPSFRPRNLDGEIDGFELWPARRVLATVRAGFSFKFNVSLVLIDFGLRHGLIDAEDPDYLALCQGLRRPAI